MLSCHQCHIVGKFRQGESLSRLSTVDSSLSRLEAIVALISRALLSGCEHFREVSIQNYNGELMFYDWSMPSNDSAFQVSHELAARVPTDWSFWKVKPSRTISHHHV